MSLSTPVPNGTGHFADLGNPTISGSLVAFNGSSGSRDGISLTYGIYVFDGSSIIPIADQNTSIPNGTGNFIDTGSAVIAGSRVAFGGRGHSGQVGIYLATPSVHNLAVVKISAPKLVFQGRGPQPVKVTVQNRGGHREVITPANLGNGVTTGLVRLDVSAVGIDDDGENCQPAIVTLHAPRNAARFKDGSVTLEPSATLTVHFRVTYSCLTARFRPMTDTTRGDYRHVAAVFHAELGKPDGQPADDICPRDLSAGGVVANSARTNDQGCRAKKPVGTFGNPVLADVVPSMMR